MGIITSSLFAKGDFPNHPRVPCDSLLLIHYPTFVTPYRLILNFPRVISFLRLISWGVHMDPARLHNNLPELNSVLINRNRVYMSAGNLFDSARRRDQFGASGSTHLVESIAGSFSTQTQNRI